MFNRRKNPARPVQIDTLIGANTRINGDLQFSGGLHLDGTIEGKDVILIEDLVDSGLTMNYLIAMLRAEHLRILAEFDGTVPDIDVRLGAHGIGASLPDNCCLDRACEILQSLERRAMPQKKFAFVTGLASGALAQAASRHHVRFGLGCALGGGVHLIDMKDVPRFPLH